MDATVRSTEIIRAWVAIVRALGIVRREHAHTRLAAIVGAGLGVVAVTIPRATSAILATYVADSVTARRHTTSRHTGFAAR
jgi:phosphohistidine swiveling domain-containing protein